MANGSYKKMEKDKDEKKTRTTNFQLSSVTRVIVREIETISILQKRRRRREQEKVIVINYMLISRINY